jgi:hypothetical protein
MADASVTAGILISGINSSRKKVPLQRELLVFLGIGWIRFPLHPAA